MLIKVKNWIVEKWRGLKCWLKWLLIGGVASASVLTGVILLEVPLIEVDGKIIEFPYTDNNSNENIIIRTDKETYKAQSIIGTPYATVYIMVENKSGKIDKLHTLFHLDQDYKIFGIYELIDETYDCSVLIATSSATLVQECEGNHWVKINPEKDLDYETLKIKSSKPIKEKKSNVSIDKKVSKSVLNGEITYYKVDIGAFASNEKEFFVEVLGEGGAYGHLDPSIFATPQDFEGLNIGDLQGQDSWTGDTEYDVQASVVYEGTKAVQIVNPSAGGERIDKAGSNTPDGDISFYVRQTTTAGTTRLVLEESGLGKIVFYLTASGYFAYYGPGGVTNIQTYNVDQWYNVRIQWEASGDTAIYSIDGGAYTSSDTALGVWTNINNLYIYADTYGETTGKTLYFDYIDEDPYPSASRQRTLSPTFE